MVRVPLYKQSYGFCGPASLRMAASYYNLERSEEEIAKLIGVKPRSGCSGERIVLAASKIELPGSFCHDLCSLAQLREYCKEFPVVVNWTFPHLWEEQPFAEGHYSVVMDVTSRKVLFAEPFYGEERSMKIGDFMSLWYDHKNSYPRKVEDFIVRRAIVIKP